MILILSLALMAVGFFFPSVPISVFYLGYGLIWMSIPFWTGARFGLAGFFLSIPCLLVFFSMLTSEGLMLVPNIEKEYPNHVPRITEEDDRIEDKNPQYVSAFTEKRSNQFGSIWCFNKSTAVFGLDLGSVTEVENELEKTIYPTFRAAMKAAADYSSENKFLPSVDLVAGFTKYFDDHLLAAIEESVHRGSSIFPGGKQGFLSSLLDELLKQPKAPGRDKAAAYLAASIELGGGHPEVAEIIRDKAQSYLDAFSGDTRNSKPVGFYTKSEALKEVFYRDRFLQKPFGTKFWHHRTPELPFYSREGLYPVIRMAETLLKNPDLMEAYRKFCQLAEKICNPVANLNLEDLFPYERYFEDEFGLFEALRDSDAWREAQGRGNVNPNTVGVAFWPFSYSKESRLMARLYQTDELPKTEVMNDLIWAIKYGDVNLEPGEHSGWYDYQLYSLETLLLPEWAHEADKLLLHAKYKKRLRQAFEAMITKHRETHVKQLFQIIMYGARAKPLPTRPELSVEPCATHYLRTARAYRFLANHLKNLFRIEDLENLGIDSADKGLLQELEDAVILFYGLYLVVCEDLGMVPQLESKEISTLPRLSAGTIVKEKMLSEFLIANSPGLSDTERIAWFSIWKKAKQWLRTLNNQKFLDEDVRIIVPVLSNYSGTEVRNWAILGIGLKKIHSYYARKPGVQPMRYSEEGCSYEVEEMLRPNDLAKSYFDWQPSDYIIPVHVFSEVTLGPEPLTRDEFRRICDSYKTKNEIIEALVGPSPKLNKLLLIFGLAAVVLIATSFVVWRFATRRQANIQRRV